MTFEIVLTGDSHKLAFRGAMSLEGGAVVRIHNLFNYKGINEIDMTQVSSWDYAAVETLRRVIAKTGRSINFDISPNDPYLQLVLSLSGLSTQKGEFAYRA